MLQEGEVRPVGEDRVQKVDVRVIAATHRDLRELCAQGRFREDLFHRLNVVHLHVPPLRERPEDAYERGLIVAALVEARGNRTHAARALGLNRGTLHSTLNEYGLAEGDDEEDGAAADA